jgi:hypothetical protein
MTRDEIIKQVLDAGKNTSKPAQIAKILNIRCTPTLSGRGQWTGDKVRSFKKRLLDETRRQAERF